MKSHYTCGDRKFLVKKKNQILDIYKIDWEYSLVYCQDKNGTYTHGIRGNKFLDGVGVSDVDGEDLYECDIIGVAYKEGKIIIGTLHYTCGEWIIECDKNFHDDGYIHLNNFFDSTCDGDVYWVNGCRKLGNEHIDNIEEFYNVSVKCLNYEEGELIENKYKRQVN